MPAASTNSITPFELAKTVKVILLYGKTRCDDVVELLDRKASLYNVKLRYILINTQPTDVQSWVLRDDMEIINRSCYNFKGELSSKYKSKFMDEECCLLFAISGTYSKILEDVAGRTVAKYKVGPKFEKSLIKYDMAFKADGAMKNYEMVENIMEHLRNFSGYGK